MAAILIVDDEHHLRESFARLLTGEGHEVRTAASGEAGLKLAKEQRFDLVVMVRARDIDEIAEIVPGAILKVPGITDSETLIAFRANSKCDQERTFSLGM